MPFAVARLTQSVDIFDLIQPAIGEGMHMVTNQAATGTAPTAPTLMSVALKSGHHYLARSLHDG